MTAAEFVATVFEDASVPHQVRVQGDLATGLLSVTCSCLIKEDGSYTAFAEGMLLGPSEILDAQRKHEAEVAR